MQIVNIVLYVIAIGFLLYFAGSWLYYRYQGKKLNGAISQKEFEENMRRAQIVDLREKNSFDAKHILGARNLPYSQLKYVEGELRPDLPVYLYDERKSICVRAALKFKKWGFEDVNWLEDKFSDWEGKTKKTTKL
ncbi:rhodanese-like domain-containing protein [Companilactobacillus mishanensis]|uniref:Rhodanese-like domain-containing protein n=1 Tax=Companilactobacillus mishanensis TaxID=2486008 RepID=A0A5P0ZEG3_9LACO|nr:rhodanese-like domain-containing protein [Companilactobacillus mishanensis]MQS44455.1 rhodanese-like domain-containing protein [Companilactobacillus mishanensis]MQS51441.1 rhodanese-like domain-containing protein [Companilactobacillus mishanensis]MQS88698.1 rhodanese-like domain-containing protein [Companilactobacillus mishanensis]